MHCMFYCLSGLSITGFRHGSLAETFGALLIAVRPFQPLSSM